MRLFVQVFLHPANDLFHAFDAVLRFTGARQFVGLVVEEHHAGFAAVHLEGSEHGQTLGHPAAVIAIGMDEKCGGDALVGVFQRRMLPQSVHVVASAGTLVILGEAVADVAGVLEYGPVGDGALGAGA